MQPSKNAVQRDSTASLSPEEIGRVLVVDDSATTRSIIKAALQSAGYSVAECTGGRDALALTSSREFDLVLLDILMSDMNGLDVLQELRQARSDTELPVIMVTVKDTNEDIAMALSLGANDYAIKPINAKVLLARVDSQIARKRAFDELREKNRELAQRAEANKASALDVTRALKRSEEKFSKTFHASPDPICLSLLEDGKVLDVNDSFVRLSGYSRQDVIGLRTTDFGLWGGPEERKAFLALMAEEGIASAWPVELYDRAGERHLCEVSAEIIELNDTKAVLAIARDVTDRKNAEKALQQSERRYRFLYEDNPSMYFTLDDELRIRSANQFGALQLGYTVEELLGRSVFDFVYTEDKELSRNFLQACFSAPQSIQSHEIRSVVKDGSLKWLKETARVIEENDGKSSLLLVCDDVTETRKLHEQLSYQASHDLLSGLVNRRGVEHRLRWVLSSPEIEHVDHVLCYLDIDNFGMINQTCGHIAGDTLIRKLSGLMRDHVRSRDTLARISGDEFAIFMEHCTLEQAEKVARGLLDKIHDFRFDWGGESYSISFSMGLSGTEGLSNPTDLMEKAQTACYSAKELGGNRVRIYRDDDVAISTRQQELKWVARINRALEADAFVLFCQSIVAIDKNLNEKEHFEILIRMLDTDGTSIAPGSFLPAAERYNISPKLDRWVIGSTMAWLVDNPQRLQNIAMCSINLSGLSIGEDEFLEFVIRHINESGVPPGKLCFEITETAAIADMGSASRFINSLKDHGCKFALDDFGSGLSSFAYLKNLAVDYLKIDGMFVKNMVEDPKDFAMARSINEVGQTMGMKTIAEFVENDAILAKLREIGVNYGQGYGIARPRSLIDPES